MRRLKASGNTAKCNVDDPNNLHEGLVLCNGCERPGKGISDWFPLEINLVLNRTHTIGYHLDPAQYVTYHSFERCTLSLQPVSPEAYGHSGIWLLGIGFLEHYPAFFDAERDEVSFGCENGGCHVTPLYGVFWADEIGEAGSVLYRWMGLMMAMMACVASLLGALWPYRSKEARYTRLRLEEEAAGP